MQPKPLDGFLGLGIVHDVAEDQFSFPPGVATIDQGIDVFALDQPFDELELGLGLADGFECKVRRDDRQVRKSPFASFDFCFRGDRQFQKVADGRGNDVIIPLVEIVFLLKASQCPADIQSHGGFFGDDKRFSHEVKAIVSNRAASGASVFSRKIDCRTIVRPGPCRAGVFPTSPSRLG